MAKPDEQFRSLLARLRAVPAAGEGTLKAWGKEMKPPLTLTQVEAHLARALSEGSATREQKKDGTYLYRAVKKGAEGEDDEREDDEREAPAPPPAAPPPALAAPPPPEAAPPPAPPALPPAAPELVPDPIWLGPARPASPAPAEEPAPQPSAVAHVAAVVATPGPMPAAPAPSTGALSLLPADLTEEQLQALLAAKRRHTRAEEAHRVALAELEASSAAWMAALRGEGPAPLAKTSPAPASASSTLGPSARKVLAALEAAAPGDLGIEELLKASGLERGSLSSMLSTLVGQGLVMRPERGRYAIARKAVA